MFKLIDNQNNTHYEGDLLGCYYFSTRLETPQNFSIMEYRDNTPIEICSAYYLVIRYNPDNLPKTLINLF